MNKLLFYKKNRIFLSASETDSGDPNIDERKSSNTYYTGDGMYIKVIFN